MITEERVLDKPQKKRGRPRLEPGGERRTAADFSFWPQEINALREVVAREGGSASYAIRRALVHYLKAHHPDLWESVKDLPR